ncbi:unnamed protein product [Ambrosiozyma monospora]|uniref:Unnamed protein product n=1 Tax=Ambrosiozyma monospora TaxID=43982 RepID=A0A9W6T983_AMBMO|nr:unnamed protein product [Ambrosiozyma monospora]
MGVEKTKILPPIANVAAASAISTPNPADILQSSTSNIINSLPSFNHNFHSTDRQNMRSRSSTNLYKSSNPNAPISVSIPPSPPINSNSNYSLNIPSTQTNNYNLFDQSTNPHFSLIYGSSNSNSNSGFNNKASSSNANRSDQQYPISLRTPPSADLPKPELFNTSLSGGLTLGGASNLANHALNINNIGNTNISNGNGNSNNIARTLNYGAGVSTPFNYQAFNPGSGGSSGRKNLLNVLNPSQLNTLSSNSSSSSGSSGSSTNGDIKSSELKATMDNANIFISNSFNDENYLTFRGTDDTPTRR